MKALKTKLAKEALKDPSIARKVVSGESFKLRGTTYNIVILDEWETIKGKRQ